MAIPSTVPWVDTVGTSRTLVPLAAKPDGIMRRVDPTSVVGYPILLASQPSRLAPTSSRKFAVNRVVLTASRARNDSVYGDFTDQITLTAMLPQIVVPSTSEAQRALFLMLMINQYLKGAAFVGADVTGGKYDVTAIGDLLTGQA